MSTYTKMNLIILTIENYLQELAFADFTRDFDQYDFIYNI